MTRRRSAAAWLAVAALAGLAVACTTSESGSGTPFVHSSGSQTPTPSATAPRTGAPATPPTGTTIAHPVDLAHVHPCTLFDAAVNAISATGGEHAPTTMQLPRMPHAPACFENNGNHNLSLVIAASTDTDLDGFDQARMADAKVQRFTVRGYPALTSAPNYMKAVCFGGVGMAKGQLLYLQYALSNPTSTPATPQERLCAKLHPIAEQVVAQLVR